MSVIKILHISDLQAGRDCLADISKASDSINSRYCTIANKLAKDAMHMLNGGIPDIIVFSGDIAAKGKVEEYEKAKIFLEHLCEVFNHFPWNNVAIVPGNHDVNYTILKREYSKQYGSKFHLKKCASISKKMEPFKNWFDTIYQNNGVNYKYEPGNPIVFDKITNPLISVIGLDSCEGITYRSEYNRGVIGTAQINKAADLLKNAGQNKINIVVMHHNPFPYNDDNSSLQKPEPILKRLDEAGCHLILAGHMHRAISVTHVFGNKQYCLNSFVTGPLCMIPRGRSFNIDDFKHKEVFPNRYQILKVNFLKSEVEVFLRRYSFERLSDSTYGAWTSDADPEYASFSGYYSVVLRPKGIIFDRPAVPSALEPYIDVISQYYKNRI